MAVGATYQVALAICWLSSQESAQRPLPTIICRMDNWQLTDRSVILENSFMRAVVDTLSRDGVSRRYTYLESPVDSVTTLALTGRREVVLTRQYRHPIGQVIFDLPGGRALPGEDPADSARRELEEETGYRPGKMELLGRFTPFPGSIKVTAHLYFASGLTPGQPHLDDGEELEVHLRPFDEVYAEVLDGRHVDAALQWAVLLARARGLA
jgi:ADP-ribose pyrophosphatase